MNFKQFCLIFAGLLLLSCDSDDYPHSEIPSVVLNKLRAEYPDAKNAEFSEVGENYEVEFEINGKDSKVLINASGNILKEKKEISWNDLPVEVRETLQTEYKVENIEDTEQVTSGGKIYYQAEVGRFLVDEEVALDKTGKRDTKINYWK